MLLITEASFLNLFIKSVALKFCSVEAEEVQKPVSTSVTATMVWMFCDQGEMLCNLLLLEGGKATCSPSKFSKLGS